MAKISRKDAQAHIEAFINANLDGLNYAPRVADAIGLATSALLNTTVWAAHVIHQTGERDFIGLYWTPYAARKAGKAFGAPEYFVLKHNIQGKRPGEA